jgi:small conductance mechanosensitive channel
VRLLVEKLNSWYEVGIKTIPNFVVSIVVLVVFVIVGKIVKKILERVLPRFTDSKAIQNLLQTSSYLAILTIGLFVALGILHLDKTVTSILAGAGVIGLALGFAFQEIAANFVSGILIAFNKPYQVGDIVEVNNYMGEVAKIEFRTTTITTFQGLEVLVPNKTMFTEAFINYTETPYRRIDIEVGVSYGDDLDKVVEVTKKALEEIDNRVKSRDIEVYFNAFGSSSINLTAMIWISYPGQNSYLVTRHQAIMNIKKAYSKNNIMIPFPIRTLDFGIKGGEKLNTMLSMKQDEKSS